MTTGIIIAIILLLLLCNLFRNKVKNAKMREGLKKAHKALGMIFIITIFVHLAFTLPLFKQRPLLMYILGFIMVCAAITEIVTFCLRKKYPKTWLRLHKIAAFVLLICTIGHVAIGLYSLTDYKKEVSVIQVGDVDLSTIKDGSYTGTCDVGYIYAKVNVKVQNHLITDVKILEHRTERGQKAEGIPEKIVKEQKITIDTVSGATNSSKVIEQAVYNALLND